MNGEFQSDINESDLPKIVGFELRYIPSIYLCDTMLVWCWVCLSQVSVLSKKAAGWIELIFGIETSFNLSHTALKEFQVFINITPKTLITSIVAMCCQLSFFGMINWIE